jgi:predicted amidohydrolase
MLSFQGKIFIRGFKTIGLSICATIMVTTISLTAQISSWSFESIRSEIDPMHTISQQKQRDNESTLLLSGANKPFVNGSWTKTFSVVPNQHYEFVTYFQSEKVEEIDRSILASITWLDNQGKRIGFIEYPGVVSHREDQWRKIQQIYQVPNQAVKAKVNLIYRWDPDGLVYFSEAELINTSAASSRLVKVGTVHLRPKQTSSSEENLKLFQPYIEQAGQSKVDIVCLPEGITLVGRNTSYLEASESIPGPTTEFLGALSKKYGMYIVAGILEKDGPVLYNTAVLLGRDGQLVGKYRKVSLPREEIDGGITPGDEFPVFDTDFGKVGMMICWDVFFPEPARKLTFSGAEMIFMPIWGGDLSLAKARAIENQVYLVSSTYDMKSGIFNKRGELMVEGTDEDPLAISEIDLNHRELWPWIGEFRNRIRREMPSKASISGISLSRQE